MRISMQKTSKNEQSRLSVSRLRRMNTILQGYVERNEIAGFVALIHHHDEEIYAEAIGWQDREAQRPMRRDTLFRIMSMTKPFTAVAALMLVE